MPKNHIKIRDDIVQAAIAAADADGWSMEGVEAAARKAGYKPEMVRAVFPGGMKDVIAHFSDMADRNMLSRLSGIDPQTMRVRERVKLAVQTRFSVLKPHKQAARHAAGYWLRPFRKYEAAKIVWRTADRIWEWAGDTATDYNRYTKRGLLSGVLASTFLAWMNDDSPDMRRTLSFLDNRIDNVMQLGKVMGKAKAAAASKTRANNG